MSDNFEVVGRVWVDAGYVLVGDPFNFPAGEDGQTMVNRLEALDNENGEYSPGIVAVKSGLGDGAYEVQVRYEEVPGWGKRVAEMRVLFLTDEMKKIGEQLLDRTTAE